MYSESELESAIAAGKLSRADADALRAHVSSLRSAPIADEEQFRLVTGFNDIFVAIAGILVLIGAGTLGRGLVHPALGGAAIAAAAWGMAEYFTRRRRMALPSIIFFAAFVLGIYWACVALYPGGAGSGLFIGTFTPRSILLTQAGAAAVIVAACWLHWQRFMVPITVAAGVAAIARFVFVLIAVAAYPHLGQWLLLVVLAAGITIFAYAMRWDTQDRERVTRRSDVAFWLHLAASPMIVHPLFVLMGLNVGIKGDNAVVTALLAITIYAGLAVIALIVDRRAILVSALVYVLAAAIYLVGRMGSSGTGFSSAIIVIGASLLMLSVFWQAMRRRLLPLLPERLRDRMPPADRAPSPRPAS